MASIDGTGSGQFTERQLALVVGGWMCLVFAAGAVLVLALP